MKLLTDVTTSGTLGDPVTFVLTSELTLTGWPTTRSCHHHHRMQQTRLRLQLMTTIDRRFMAGLAYHTGARELGMGGSPCGKRHSRICNGTLSGASSIPLAAWEILFPFLIKLIEFAEKNHIHYHHCSMQKCVCIGEALRNPDFTLNTLGKRIHEKMGFPATLLHLRIYRNAILVYRM